MQTSAEEMARAAQQKIELLRELEAMKEALHKVKLEKENLMKDMQRLNVSGGSGSSNYHGNQALSDAEQQKLKDNEYQELREASKLYDKEQQMLKEKQMEEGILDF